MYVYTAYIMIKYHFHVSYNVTLGPEWLKMHYNINSILEVLNIYESSTKYVYFFAFKISKGLYKTGNNLVNIHELWNPIFLPNSKPGSATSATLNIIFQCIRANIARISQECMSQKSIFLWYTCSYICNSVTNHLAQWILGGETNKQIQFYTANDTIKISHFTNQVRL